jgi:hypothetical protein
LSTKDGSIVLDIFEDGVPPRFRIYADTGPAPSAAAVSIETVRPDGARQSFRFADRGDYLESIDEIPEPHAFTANVSVDGENVPAIFAEHEHTNAHRDNNMRAAVIHVIADAAVSVLVIAGLLLARAFGWLWMDPLAGIIGACVIASWSYGLIRDTAAILLDMNPDRAMAQNLRATIEREGDRLADLIYGGWGRVISARSCRSSRPPSGRPTITAPSSPGSAPCPISRSRSFASRAVVVATLAVDLCAARSSTRSESRVWRGCGYVVGMLRITSRADVVASRLPSARAAFGGKR